MQLEDNRYHIHWFYNHPYLLSTLTFVVVFGLSFLIAQKDLWINQEKEAHKATETLQEVEGKIDQILKSSYVTTLSIALTIDDNGKPKNFNAVAEKLFNSNPNIDGIELVPDGVIKYVYPFEEHKGAIGLNVLDYEYSKTEAKKSIESGKMFFAGPLKFKQGGFGIIGRLPVYADDGFWGFSAVMINLETFLEKSGIQNLADEGYNYRFTKINPNTGEREIFNDNNSEDFDFSKAEKIVVEDSEWEIYLGQDNSHKAFIAASPFLIFGLFLAFGCALLTYVVLQRPAQLQRYIKLQTAKLLNSEIKYKAIFQEAGMAIIHLDENEKFIEANPKFLSKTGYTIDELKGEKFSKFLQLQDDSFKKLLNHDKFEGKLICKRGLKKIVRVTNSALEVNHQITHILLIEDVTKRKKSEKKLKDLQDRMQMAIRISKLAYWDWEPEKGKIRWSDRMYKIFDIDKNQKLDSDVLSNRIHPEDFEKYKQDLKRIIETKEGTTLELRILDTNNKLKHILTRVECETSENGIFKVKGTTVDVTDKKEAMINLQHSYQMVVEQNERLLNFSYIVSHNLRSHSSNIQGLIHLIRDLETFEEKKEMFNLLEEVTISLDETLTDLNEVIHIQKSDGGLVEEITLKPFLQRIKNILKREIKYNNITITENIPEGEQLKFNPAYLESVLLNIISNAIKYRDKQRNSEINLIFSETEEFKILQIKDNGIGIDLDSYKGQIFGMYETFTDFKNSRGIGLFVTNNQMKALGGKIEIESELNKGSVFTLYFKK